LFQGGIDLWIRGYALKLAVRRTESLKDSDIVERQNVGRTIGLKSAEKDAGETAMREGLDSMV